MNATARDSAIGVTLLMWPVGIGGFETRQDAVIEPDAHMRHAAFVLTVENFAHAIEPGKRAAIGKFDIQPDDGPAVHQPAVDHAQQPLGSVAGQGRYRQYFRPTLF